MARLYSSESFKQLLSDIEHATDDRKRHEALGSLLRDVNDRVLTIEERINELGQVDPVIFDRMAKLVLGDVGYNIQGLVERVDRMANGVRGLTVAIACEAILFMVAILIALWTSGL